MSGVYKMQIARALMCLTLLGIFVVNAQAQKNNLNEVRQYDFFGEDDVFEPQSEDEQDFVVFEAFGSFAQASVAGVSLSQCRPSGNKCSFSGSATRWFKSGSSCYSRWACRREGFSTSSGCYRSCRIHIYKYYIFQNSKICI